jgi:hypothetical protein
MPAKRPPSTVVPVSKKPRLQHVFSCPTPGCNTSSKSVIGLNIHLRKSPKCARFQTFKSHRKVTTVVQTPLEALLEASDYPWDDEDSLDEFNEAVNGNIEGSTNGFEAPPAHPAGTYSESTNDSALRFGIRFTTEQYHETKLLKILRDATSTDPFLAL